MANTAKFKVVNDFADDTTRDIEFGPFDANDINIETLRTNIQNFDVNAIKAAYLSDGGAQFSGIGAASVTVTNEREINLNINE